MFTSEANKWLFEYYGPREINLLAIEQCLISKITQYQKMEILMTSRYGKCLTLDGRMQSAELDEFIYHEMLVQPAMMVHPHPKDILIIGGGEGATLREVLKCQTVSKAKMIDIDKELVEHCKNFLPEWSQGAFEDKRTTLIYADAKKYIKEHNEKFDVIIIDLTEPTRGTSYLLFTKEFYEIILKKLNPSGIITLQAGRIEPGDNTKSLFTTAINTLKVCFPIVYGYSAYVPSFQRLWGFVFASRKDDPINISKDKIEKRIKKRIISTLNYYNSEIHFASFSLPNYLKENILSQKNIILDKEYLELY